VKEYILVERKKDKSGWLVLLGAAFFVAFWKWVLVSLIGYCIGLAIRKAWRLYQAHKDKMISRQASIAMRADHENQLAMAGDPVGIYGRYDAVTMPMTYPLPPAVRVGWDDFDDGFKDWK